MNSAFTIEFCNPRSIRHALTASCERTSHILTSHLEFDVGAGEEACEHNHHYCENC